MKLINILQKLGILRVGSIGGTYKNYKDMPDELMFDNAYKKTDLVNKDERQKFKDSLANKKQKPSNNGSGLLFYILLTLSITITLFFALIIGYNLGLIFLFVILIIFLFLLYRYKSGLSSLKFIWLFFIAYLFISITILFIATPKNNQAETESAPSNTKKTNQIETENKEIPAQLTNESEWVDYTGENSNIFSFRYPRSYEIQESGATVMVYVDKTKDYDYHLQFSAVDGNIPVSQDCELLANNVIAGFPGGELRYAKSLNIGNSTGCEYGINIEQNGSKIYEISYNFATSNKTYYITSYAKKLSDLDILLRVMQTFNLK